MKRSTPALPRPADRLRTALDVAARVGAAIVAGYFLAHAFSAFMTLVLPFARPDRVVAATLPAFLVWAAAAIHAFAARSAWRAWWPPMLAGAVMLGIAMAFPEAAARP